LDVAAQLVKIVFGHREALARIHGFIHHNTALNVAAKLIKIIFGNGKPRITGAKSTINIYTALDVAA
jgi:hypothetical protein